MSLAGVRSNRGDSYQNLIAINWVLNILSNDKYQWIEVDSTSLDAIGKPISVDDVVIGLRDGSMICCQCKKNQIDFESWSVADLADELVKAARFLATNPRSQVYFYTRGSFGSLAKLREYSATQPNETAYQRNLSKELKKTDLALAAEVSGNPGISNYELLSRITFEQTPDFDQYQDLLLERLTCLVSNAEGAFNALWVKIDMLGARIGERENALATPSHRLPKLALLEILEKAGAAIFPPLPQQELHKVFATTSAIGRHWRRDIGGSRLHCLAVDELVRSIDSKAKSILLTGIPGSGKTCSLLELQEILETRGDLAALFIQAREFANCTTPAARISQGLPEDLVGQVGRMADSQHTVVIIDSLDVLSLSREHSALSYFLAQVDRLLLIPNVTVIAACRDFDRKYDSRLSERKWDRTVINGPLDWGTVVAPLLITYGVDPSVLDSSTKSLLRNPRELALFADVAKRNGCFNVATSQALSRKYLEAIVLNDPALGSTAMVAIEKMAEAMLASRRLDVPRSNARMPDEMLMRLLSAGVLHENQSGGIEFGHQTLLDVLVVSGAEREVLSLKGLIERLPAVPFVRPTIRAYVAYLAMGDRLSFRRHLRAVFDSDAAFHIRRLVAESLAEQIPLDEDWPLIQHLHQRHRELFNSLHANGSSIEWHHFWLKYFVPYVVQEQDSHSLAGHVQRIAHWKKSAPEDVISFWNEALKYNWAKHDQLAWLIAHALRDFDFNIEISVAPLINQLLRFPHREYYSLGHVLAKCVEAGKAEDDLLWNYITGDIGEEDVLKYQFDSKLRCNPHDFGVDNYLRNRMMQSEHLLDLAIASVEQWNAIMSAKYNGSEDFYDCFLRDTSYREEHSRQEFRHLSAEMLLFQAMEDAIRHHAKKHTAWWIQHRKKLCLSREGALRFFAILALTEFPERNIEEVELLLLDKHMLGSSLSYEIGSLLHVAFPYLNQHTQDAILYAILTLWNDEDTTQKPWILAERVQLLSAIPLHLRSGDAQIMLSSWEQKFGPYIRQPQIYMRGGAVGAPFSYQVFLDSNDAGVLKILSHYRESGYFNQDHEFLVGGQEQVGWQLNEATSRNPTRFLRLLTQHWVVIPDRFIDDILEGAATYLARRFGNLTYNADQWKPTEEPNPQSLAALILDEIDRHPGYWYHRRATAKALEACANVVQDRKYAARLLFSAIGFAMQKEDEKDNGSASIDLLNKGIGMIRGNAAEAVMTLAIKWAEKHLQFPDLLTPTLKRFALDQSPAVRALILQRLAYFQSLSPELGWEIFYLALKDNDERLWEIAEPCLYYAYHNRFIEIARILDRISSTGTGVALEIWGRISALAALSGYIHLSDFLSSLQSLNSIDAWKGATSVWAHNVNQKQHSDQCFLGIRTGFQESGHVALAVAKGMQSMFREQEYLILVPPDVVDMYFSAIEQEQNTSHAYGFDEWLNVISQRRPDDALTSAERFANFLRHTKYEYFDHSAISQLLTRLFREAEEREEADNGNMLHRVIKLQDNFLAIGVDGLQNWLRDAERP